MSHKEIQTQCRGTHLEMVSIQEDAEIRITKWYNKAIHLLSMYASANSD